MQFSAGAIVTVISGALADQGALGLVAVMLACAAVSGLICWRFFPRQP